MQHPRGRPSNESCAGVPKPPPSKRFSHHEMVVFAKAKTAQHWKGNWDAFQDSKGRAFGARGPGVVARPHLGPRRKAIKKNILLLLSIRMIFLQTCIELISNCFSKFKKGNRLIMFLLVPLLKPLAVIDSRLLQVRFKGIV